MSYKTLVHDLIVSYYTLLIISYWYWKESTGVKDNI